MRLVSVTTLIPTRSGFAWFPAEVNLPDHLPDDQVIALCRQELRETGAIQVTKLELENGDGRTRVVSKRVPTLMTVGMVGMIQPLSASFLER